MAIFDQPEVPREKLLCEKFYSELKLADVSSEGLANSIQSFTDLSAKKHGITGRLLEVLDASAERMNWLSRRVRAYEGNRDTSEVSNKRVETGTRLLEANMAVLTSILPVIHPEYGLEPTPFVTDSSTGKIRRFANHDWLDWYNKVSPSGENHLLVACAERTVSMLFPTDRCKQGINWAAYSELTQDPQTNETFFHKEIVIWRVTSDRV